MLCENIKFFDISPLDTSQKADGRRIHDYLHTSVLVACLCFYMPTGLLAVRYAHKVPTDKLQYLSSYCNAIYRCLEKTHT